MLINSKNSKEFLKIDCLKRVYSMHIILKISQHIKNYKKILEKYEVSLKNIKVSFYMILIKFILIIILTLSYNVMLKKIIYNFLILTFSKIPKFFEI